jgi:acetoacetyl-CoA synthetase
MFDRSATGDARQVTWQPTNAQRHQTRIWDFMRWVEATRHVHLADYRALWRWSIDDLSGFWDAVREYFDVLGEGFDTPALSEERMPGAIWYPSARLNFAENVLRYADSPGSCDTTAVLSIREDDSTSELTWLELRDRVASLAGRLRALGVEPGDRVAAVLPNIPEALIGLLATASIGAVWSINSPDLSATATLERLRQLEPTVLIGVDGYQFNGNDIDRLEYLAEIEAGLASVAHTIVVRNPGRMRHAAITEGARAQRLDFSTLIVDIVEPRYERVPFDQPLWVLFSSGTTGMPKGIVHGHGGMTLEALKGTALNQNMGAGDRYYVAANTSWMVWNTLVNNLMSGASVVTYSGSPLFASPDRQFNIIARTRTTMFATGAAYLSLVEKSGLDPGRTHDLSALVSIMSTGSPLPASTWRWVHEHVKHDVHLGSDSGGTDICSGFIGSNPLEPVHVGEIQGPLLGVAVEAWSESGRRVVAEVGEMVITRPMPSMPVFFWGDDGSRYLSSYFERFPGIWTQGDWITETVDGAFVVHGRSDATLNRAGVRLGSADIYAALQHIPDVRESLVIGLEQPDGGYYMPLYVVLVDGGEMSEELEKRIRVTIRELASARHVPDDIILAPAIPVTHAQKKIEVPLKKLFLGHSPETAINRGALANPESIDWFIDRAARYLTELDRHQ